MGLLKREMSHVRDFYRSEFRPVLKSTAVSFLVLAVIGFIAGMFMPHIAENFFERFAQQILDAGIIQDDGTVSASVLFVNNFRAAFYTMLYGFIPFVFLPALSLGLNSLMLGLFAAYYIHHDMPIMQYIMGILPHGIFELPALIIAVALGLYLCRYITDVLRHRSSGGLLLAISNSSRILLLTTVPLLALASIIEAYITPLIMNLF